MKKAIFFSAGILASLGMLFFVVSMPSAQAETFAVAGVVKMPDGTPVDGSTGGVGVQLHTTDFSQYFGGGVDSSGNFGIPVTGPDGTVTSGTTYVLEVWVGNLEGAISPDPVSVVYNGATINKTITLVAASKTLNVSVKYGDGTGVATANIWANKSQGGGGVGKNVGSNGTASLSVSGGSWEVMLNCPWDDQNNQPGDCDWMYNQPPLFVDFKNDSSSETKSVNFVVTKANAKIKGKVVLPNGTPLQGGFVDMRSGNQGGAGTGIDGQTGSFIANVTAGDYTLSIYPDQSNPDLLRYYIDEIAVRATDGQTKDLGTIVMQQKTSRIVGQVVDKNGAGVPNVWVNTWMRNNPGWANIQADVKGRFVLWVQPGEWEVTIDTGRGGEGSMYIPTDSRPISVEIAANETVSGVNIAVQLADATVKAKVVDQNGNGVSNMFGYAFCRKVGGGFGPGSEFGAGMDRGVANIALLGGFDYTCGLHMPPEGGDFSLAKEVSVTVGVGKTVEAVLTIVPNDATIRGFVKDQNGNLVTGVEGEVFAVEIGVWQWKPTRLQSDGSFSISVRGGKSYETGVHFWGGRGSTGYVESFGGGGSAISVPVNGTVTKIITVFKADSEITGIVLDPDGNPVPWAWVGANNFRFQEDKIQADVEGAKVLDTGTETRGDGTFRIEIIAGEFEVFAGLPPEFGGDWMPPKEVTVTTSPSSPATDVVMQFRQADAFVVATAILPDGSSPDFGFCHAWSETGGFSGKEIFGSSTARIPLTAGTWNIGCDTYNPGSDKFFRSDEQVVTLAKGNTVPKTFNLVEGLFSIPEGYSETFSATNQKVFNLPDGTTVTIPANALATEGNITFIAEPDINLFHTSDTKPINFAWNFEALDGNGQLVETFNSNVSICIPYDQEYLDIIGVNENTIVAKYYNTSAGAWQLPNGVTQDTTNDIVCFSVNHFTNFALATGSSVVGGTGGPSFVMATPISNGGPQVTVWNGSGDAMLNFFAFASTLRIGIQAESGDLDGDGTNEIIVAPGKGAGPQIRVFDLKGNVIDQFWAFASHIRTGVKIAVADVDGDGKDEIIVTTMAGAGPQIRIFNGSGGLESQFFVFAEDFRGGVNMTTGDVDGDGTLEIIVVPESGAGPRVKVYNYDGTIVSEFWAYAQTVVGGYNVNTGDVDNDGDVDIVVAPKAGLGPQIAMFDGSGNVLGRFFAYASTFRGGVNVSVGDISGNGSNEIVASPESNAGPQIRVFNASGTVLSQFWAYASTLRGNFVSMIADVDLDGVSDIVTAPGPGMGPHVRAFNYSGDPVAQFFTHHTGFRGGINISSIPTF